MITLPGIHSKINTQVLPAFMYVRPDHSVVVRRSNKGNKHDKIMIGMTIPLAASAARQYAKSLGGAWDYSVIKRKTATQRGLTY